MQRNQPFPVSKKRKNNPILLVTQLEMNTLILPNLSAKIPDGNSAKKVTTQKMAKKILGSV